MDGTYSELCKLVISEASGVVAIEACDKHRWALLLADDAAFVVENKPQTDDAFGTCLFVATGAVRGEVELACTDGTDILHLCLPCNS